MSRFAIFYNSADLEPLETGLMSLDLGLPDRLIALSFWNAGIKNWREAPMAPLDHADGDRDCRIVVADALVDTMADFRNLLLRIASSTNVPLLRKLSEDMGRFSGAVEPWP